MTLNSIVTTRCLTEPESSDLLEILAYFTEDARQNDLLAAYGHTPAERLADLK